MSMIYDNWERLVAATLDREKLRELALASSFSSCSFTDDDSDLSHTFSFNSDVLVRSGTSSGTGGGGGFAAGAAHLFANQVITAADQATVFKQECAEIKSKAKRLAELLRQASRVGGDVYDRPAHRIMDNTEQVLGRALFLLRKCHGHGLRRMFTLIPAAAFRKMSAHLDNSIHNVSWLLCVSDDEMLDVPPIAANEPILSLIWHQIAVLSTGSPDRRANAAETLASLTRDNDRYGKMIIEEGGVGPLLKLVKEGKVEEQRNAATTIGLLGRDPESVEHMIHAGVCQMFVEMLKNGSRKVQAIVAWAVSELVAHYPKWQDHFAQHNIIPVLVGHLLFETIQKDNKYSVTVMHANGVNSMPNNHQQPRVNKEMEDPSTKENMNAMVVRALYHLAKGNSLICRRITDPRALLCFAILLETGPPKVQYNSAIALMEITAVAEMDVELRRSVFRTNSCAFNATIDQLLLAIDEANSELLLPCVKAIGNLAATFKASEMRVIGPLVNLLDKGEAEVTKEACIALTKFASSYNYHCRYRSKAIIEAHGAKHLVELLYLGDHLRDALILLCYITINVPRSEKLARAGVLTVLEWASNQPYVIQVLEVKDLLQEAKRKLKIVKRSKSAVHT